jgi:hypothetical protein
MKKIALYLFVLVPAALSAMDGYQLFTDDQPGHFPTTEELAEGYVPTDADFKAGYVPTLQSMQNKQFNMTHAIARRFTFEATFPDDSTLQIIFNKGEFETYDIFDPEIPTEKVFAQNHVPTQQEISDGFSPNFFWLNGNSNFREMPKGYGRTCFKSLQPNADGVKVVVWLDEDGDYYGSRFKQVKPALPLNPDKIDGLSDAKHPIDGVKKSKPGLFTYLRQNKFKFGICCGLLGILAFVINKYGKAELKKSA